MKKIYWLIAVFGMAFIILLATCNKKQASDQIEKVTYSKNFDNTLTNANIWFDFDFEYISASNNQEIEAKKLIVESFYTNYLSTHQIQKHEIYFKWLNTSVEPLRYRLIGYITPPQTKVTNGRSDGTMTADPPTVPPPPPPSRS